MKAGVLLFIIVFVTGCASKAPVRKIASVATVFESQEVDLKKSVVNIFPAVPEDDGLWYYFYVQLKNKDGKYVDCYINDLKLKTDQGKKVNFKFDRVSEGRYYLTIEKTADINSSHLNFFVAGKPLVQKLRLTKSYPDKLFSKIIIHANDPHKLVFRLHLADKNNRPVILHDRPEIIVEGAGIVEDLNYIKDGIWEFSVIYSEHNQIMYFSARAQGQLLSNMFRYQHVEKDFH